MYVSQATEKNLYTMQHIKNMIENIQVLPCKSKLLTLVGLGANWAWLCEYITGTVGPPSFDSFMEIHEEKK